MAIKDENIRIQVVISRKVHAKLKDQAEYDGRSISNMAAKIINDYYKYDEETKE